MTSITAYLISFFGVVSVCEYWVKRLHTPSCHEYIQSKGIDLKVLTEVWMGFAIPFFLIRSTSHIRINHQLFFKSGIASKTADWRLSSAFGPPGFQLSSLLTKCPPACSHMATICPQIGINDGGLRQMLSINKDSQCRRNGKWEIEINQNELYSFSKEIHKRFVDNSLF